jgi:EAL domain-containing protein (putative c-di-GMP-specific phosphodiesterase class I)
LVSALIERSIALWMAFQPIVSWRERTVFGYEALVRSDEPKLPFRRAFLRPGTISDVSTSWGRAIRTGVAAAAARRSGATSKELFVSV